MADEDGEVVRVDRKTRRVVTRLMLGVMATLVACAVVSQTRLVRRHPSLASICGMTAIALAGGALLILRVTRSQVVLYPDSLEVTQYPLPTRRVARSDIVSRYFSPPGYRKPGYHVLVTRDGGRLKLPPYLETNGSLRAWLNSVPHLPSGRRRLVRPVR
jgi:hypothetical protein